MSYIAQINVDIQKSNYTNLYLAEILILDYLSNNEYYSGLSKTEISAIWAREPRYIKQFYPSYCQRKLDQSGGLLTLEGDKYKINEPEHVLINLLDGKLLQEIRVAIDAPNPIHSRIKLFENIDSSEVLYNQMNELLQTGSPNDFEVISYAVLNCYLDSFGFSLKRFTSTNANDGGVDFIGGDVVYCVTTLLSKSKLENDIQKTHAKKIFIYRNTLSAKLEESIKEYIKEGKISDVLSVNQVIERYVTFLKNKAPEYGLLSKLKTTIINEYSKEIL
jgi:hypothetical protein